MYDVYMKRIHIEKVRHLAGVDIEFSTEGKKNLILTGKNGSGKTSVLNAISNQLNRLSTGRGFAAIEGDIQSVSKVINRLETNGGLENDVQQMRKSLNQLESELSDTRNGLDIDYSVDVDGMRTHFERGEYVLAYYKAERFFRAEIVNHIEKVNIRDTYTIDQSPRNEFLKYIADMKISEALAETSDKREKATRIRAWFDAFEREIKRIFDDESTRIIFDTDTFQFSMVQEGKEPFGFNELSDGFAAVLDIVVDIMMRMAHNANGDFLFDMPGIVLIDEIETHLHLELQKKVMGFLTSLFPNLQFIVSTHSPFIINSTENAVVYDIENRMCISDGLTDLPYEGIVEGYFGVERLSDRLKRMYDRYKILTGKVSLSKEEMREIIELEDYLDEIPDYLALDFALDYSILKETFARRRRMNANGKD